jgi:threonine dehydratase
LRPGDLTFAHVHRFIDQVVTVDDGAIVDAVLWLLENAKMVVEPSGAATVAAVLSGRVAIEGPIVAIVSGGNVDMDRLDEFRRTRTA